MPSLQAVRHPLSDTDEQLRILERTGTASFDDVLAENGLPLLTTARIDVLQVNVGRLCNQTCAHCHVDAGPDRREAMTEDTARQVIELLR